MDLASDLESGLEPWIWSRSMDQEPRPRYQDGHARMTRTGHARVDQDVPRVVPPGCTQGGVVTATRVHGRMAYTKEVVGLNKGLTTGPNRGSMRILSLTGLRTDPDIYSTS